MLFHLNKNNSRRIFIRTWSLPSNSVFVGLVGRPRYFEAVRWYARPESHPLQLSVAPRLASWNKADDPDQVRLRKYLDDAEVLLESSKVKGPRALRLDVGLSPERDLLNMADLDNYAYPLACRLKDPSLVSVWCTKGHSEQSFVRVAPAEEVLPPSAGWLVATTSASTSTRAYKEQIRAAVAGAAELPPGPVRLQLSFVVGPQRNWLNLWKQTIDALDPILGRTYPNRDWNPLDGRITELGLHLTVDPAAGIAVKVGIAAGQEGDTAAVQPIEELATQKMLRKNQISVEGRRSLVFRDDDSGYLDWLAAHPDGHVINIPRNHSATAARVHRADCRTINGQNPHKGAWTGPYIKVCAEQLADIQQWAADNVRGAIAPCGTCNPPWAS